jgi:hypothetical protein
VARSAERGFVFGCGVFGHNLNKGVLSVNEDLAPVVRRIFHEFAYERKGIAAIVREFNATGVPRGNLKERTVNKIPRMLKDERYAGDPVQRKIHKRVTA